MPCHKSVGRHEALRISRLAGIYLFRNIFVIVGIKHKSRIGIAYRFGTVYHIIITELSSGYGSRYSRLEIAECRAFDLFVYIIHHIVIAAYISVP